MSVRMSVRRGPQQVALGRAQRCQVCSQPPAYGQMLCTDCCLEVARMLDPSWEGDRDEQIPASIPVYWSRLDPMPATTSQSDRRAPGFHSSPPLQLDVVVIRDRRSRPDPVVPVWYPPRPDGKDDWLRPLRELDDEPRPIEWSVICLATSVWEHIEMQGPLRPSGRVVPGGVEEHCSWMLANIDSVTALPHAGEVHRDLTSLIEDLRGPAGDPPDRSIGPCRGLVSRAGQHDRVPCGEPLYLPPPRPGVAVPPKAPVLRCRRCDEPYTTADLLRMELGRELRYAAS